MIQICYLDKKGNGDENGKHYVYEQIKTMEEAKCIAKEMTKKGFSDVMIIDDGKECWETLQKWLKRSIELTNMVFEDKTATKEEKQLLQEKKKTFQLCLKKMEDIEKTW